MWAPFKEPSLRKLSFQRLQSTMHMYGVYFVQFDPQLKLNLINIFKQG